MSKLAEAVHAVRAHGLVVIRTGKNTGLGGAKYATYTDIWERLSPLLANHDISVGFSPGSVRRETDAWIQTLTMSVSVGDERETVPFEIVFPEGNRGVNITQRQGMAHTYGRRYAVTDYFNIFTGDDDDAQRLGAERDRADGPSVSDAAPWSALMQHGWLDVATKDGTALGELTNAQRKALWEKDPDNKALMAWVGDMLSDMLQQSGYAWPRFVEWAGLDLPARMEDCNAGQLRTAIQKAKNIPDA